MRGIGMLAVDGGFVSVIIDAPLTQYSEVSPRAHRNYWRRRNESDKRDAKFAELKAVRMG